MEAEQPRAFPNCPRNRFNGQIVSRLPLDIEGLVERIWKLVPCCISAKVKSCGLPILNIRTRPPVWQAFIDIVGFPLGALGAVSPHGFAKSPPFGFPAFTIGAHVGMKPLVVASDIGARLRIHIRRRLVDSKRSASDEAGRSETRRKIREEFAAIVINAPASAHDDLAVESLGLHATPRRGARPHCLPVNVELLTPLVGNSNCFQQQ